MPGGCRFSSRRGRNRRPALFSRVTFLAWAIVVSSLFGFSTPRALCQDFSQYLTLSFSGRGFQGPPVTISEGSTFFRVSNLTFIPDLTLQLDYFAPGSTGEPTVVRRVMFTLRHNVWRETVYLQAGYYTLWVVENPRWSIQITVGDVPPWPQRPPVSQRPTPGGNSAPRFTSPAAFSVTENNLRVGTVTARDFESADRITGYAITGGEDRALFSITDEGVLSFATVPYYRDPMDADGDNTYIVVVTVSSGTGVRERTAEQTISVTVTPAEGLRILPAPISSADLSERIVVTNAGEDEAVITYWAVDASGGALSGTDITNPRTLTLQANQTSVSLLDHLFGVGVVDEPVASVQIETLDESVIGTVIGTAGGRRYASPLAGTGDHAYVPFERATAVDVPVVILHNGGTEEATIMTTLRDATGRLAATATTTLSAQGGMRSEMTELFDLDAVALPFEGYVAARGRDVWASILQNDANGTVRIPSSAADGRERAVIPYVVFGGGYDTILTFVNASTSITAQLRITPYPLAGGSPRETFTASAPPRERFDVDLAAIYGGEELSRGYVVVETEGMSSFPVSILPRLSGVVSVRRGDLAAASRLFSRAGTVLSFTPTASTASEATGLAILNDGQAAAEVTVEAFSRAGAGLGSTAFELNAGDLSVQMLRDLIPTAPEHTGGYVKLTADRAVRAVAYRGTMALDELLVLEGQATP